MLCQRTADASGTSEIAVLTDVVLCICTKMIFMWRIKLMLPAKERMVVVVVEDIELAEI